ncbi:uncharacterized protein [Oscarella lobularis]|uniref:uncharacterized protein n=1 Tax=Oscarella lobularis TaxID=121494 RepID=UPI0033140084
MFSSSILVIVVAASWTAILFSPVESIHFRGFTINFHPVGNQANGDAGKLQFNFRISWSRSSFEGGCTDASIADQILLGSPVRFRCLSNNCGLHVWRGSQVFSATLEYVCTSFSASNDWASGTNTFEATFPVADSQEFIIGNDFERTYGCCWIETQNAFGDLIRFQTRISFVPRTDSAGVINRGQINQSPVADMVPVLPARVGCEFKLIIPNVDPDFDDVKCRWALPKNTDDTNECGSACIDNNKVSGLFINATLVEEDCEIIWKPSVAALYAAAVQLEDFYPTDADRMNPLSSIPLQWLIDVVDTGTPCGATPIFPVQEHIPREQPRCFAVESGGSLTLEISVGHSNFPSNSIDDAVYILPRGMSVTNLMDIGNGVKAVTFAWTPDEEQTNRPHIMCFQFLDDVRAPSNLVCFTVVTSVPQPKPILNTQAEAPLVDGQVAFDAVAGITFDQDVKNPSVSPRFISVHHAASGTLIQQIDSSDTSLVRISANRRTVLFQLDSAQPNIYQKDEEYEIVFEEGAVVGTGASCAGGGPVAKGILKGEWKFISAGPPNECLDNTDNCHDVANCIDLPDGFRCECMTGYTGDGVNNCDDIDECTLETDDCHATATCTNTDGRFTCACMPGYTGNGKNCVDINECTAGTDNCHMHADCTNTDGSFECACRFGFNGNGLSCTDVNECDDGTDFDCDENIQQCVNTVGDYSCTCMRGYKIDGDATTDPTRPVCVDCNECLPECPDAIDEECHAEATCSNTAGSYDCTCNAGCEPDPSSGKPANRPVCIDINECLNDADNNCHMNANCLNFIGSFECNCKPGYTGNGVSCADINECTDGSHDCHANAMCTNTDGSFDCSCMLGYKPDCSGAPDNRPVCVDCNECLGECADSITDKGACDLNADCANTPESFDCTCKDGYERQAGTPVDRPTCINIDECARGTDTCHAMATCIDANPPLKFDCQCMQGYKAGAGSMPNRPVCENCDECTPGDCPVAPDPFCHEKATCTDSPGSFSCICMIGYEGNGFNCIDVSN